MPHSDEPLNPPQVSFVTRTAGQWLGVHYYIADIHGGSVVLACDPDGYFSDAEIEAEAIAYRERRRKRRSETS